MRDDLTAPSSFPESGDNAEYYDWNEEEEECGDPYTPNCDVR